MPNSTGIITTEFGVRNQILANVEHQYSVGCVVDASLGVAPSGTNGNQKIARAGTPISMNLMSTNTPAVLADDDTNAMTGVLLHDVDVTNGNNNGTCLIFGFVNLNSIDSDIEGQIVAAMSNDNATKRVTFLKV